MFCTHILPFRAYRCPAQEAEIPSEVQPLESISGGGGSTLSDSTNSTDVIAWARKYRERGLGITRVKPGDKRPGYRDWTLGSLEPEDFAPDANIGILTGTLSGNLVCVDLDAQETIGRADEFLPPTSMIEGRPSKPRSHRYYRVKNIPPVLTVPAKSVSGKELGGPGSCAFSIERSQDGSRKPVCLVEILGTGRHATAPPSLHESGEYRTWHEFGEPAEVDCRELFQAVERLARACGWQPKEVVKAPGAGLNGYRPKGSTEQLPGLPAMEVRKDRAQAYLSKLDAAVSGQGGHNQTFKAACLLVREFALDLDDAWELLCEYNERCQPPWTEAELRHKLEDADKFDGPRGCKLQDQNDHVEPVELKEASDDPHRLARVFVQRDGLVDDLPCWRYWRQEWWCWNGSRYLRFDDKDLRAKLTGVIREELEAVQQKQAQQLLAEYQVKLKTWSPLSGKSQPTPPRIPEVRPVTTQLVNNTLLALTSMTLLSSEIEQPSWLHDENKAESRSFIALNNGLLDVEVYLAGSGFHLKPHNPRWFSRVCLPYDWNVAARCPQWKAALDLIFHGDQELVNLMQEWFGYCLLPDTDQQKFIMLVGEGNNGKSVICAVLAAVLGLDNVSHVSLEAFNDRFALTGTLGKLANIVAEIGELDKSAEGKLKMFTAGDRMTFDRKGISPIEALPKARLVLATNNLPRFSDRTSGLWRRLLAVPCKVVIPEAKRVPGMDKSAWWEKSGELPAILRWALEGLRRLQQQGGFSESEACKKLLEQYRIDSNPARAFLLETCEVHDGFFVSCNSLYQLYTEWCDKNGYRGPLANNAFGKEVQRVFPGVERERRNHEGKRSWVYNGLKVKEPSRYGMMIPGLVVGRMQGGLN